jgi:DNA-binding GntR family transcriptional regulator
MTATTPVLRTTLRAETRTRCARSDGRLAPGANVVERDLSDTSASAAPAPRGALGLQAEGLFRLEPQRGFFVADLTVTEARELYPRSARWRRWR